MYAINNKRQVGWDDTVHERRGSTCGPAVTRCRCPMAARPEVANAAALPVTMVGQDLQAADEGAGQDCPACCQRSGHLYREPASPQWLQDCPSARVNLMREVVQRVAGLASEPPSYRWVGDR